MFVIGIFVGPFIGLLLGYFALRSRSVGPWFAALIAVLVLIFMLFAAFVPLELRLGTVAGYLLGLLLSMTPFAMADDDASEAISGDVPA